MNAQPRGWALFRPFTCCTCWRAASNASTRWAITTATCTNVIVKRCGIGFELKLLDLYYWRASRSENIHSDVIDLIHIFYEALGGQQHYARQPPEVKAICCGLKRSLLRTRFRTASSLRAHLENMEWS